jgi:Rps23 Pro-64 3,4-dihydroxylase Tpa1-like proline 4-hydroxylase
MQPVSGETPAARDTALRTPVLVVDGFLSVSLADAMRQDIDAHFANPDAHRSDTHQVWNYWSVPELYTYLRTDPDKVIRGDLMESFHRALRRWSIGRLGLVKVTAPYLSLYVCGCRQGWHNDATNGRFAFVYSLTRDQRRTTGGETLVMHEGDLVRRHLTQPAAGRGLYDAIEPRFNRLVVFDDRMPHAVKQVEGVMEPSEGRFVLHGHLSEGGTAVVGVLPVAAVADALRDAIRSFRDEAATRLSLYHGIVSFSLLIAPSGRVRSCDVLMDRVLHPDSGHVEWEPLRDNLAARLRALRFASAERETRVIQPVVFGRELFAAATPASGQTASV